MHADNGGIEEVPWHWKGRNETPSDRVCWANDGLNFKPKTLTWQDHQDVWCVTCSTGQMEQSRRSHGVHIL